MGATARGGSSSPAISGQPAPELNAEHFHYRVDVGGHGFQTCRCTYFRCYRAAVSRALSKLVSDVRPTCDVLRYTRAKLKEASDRRGNSGSDNCHSHSDPVCFRFHIAELFFRDSSYRTVVFCACFRDHSSFLDSWVPLHSRDHCRADDSHFHSDLLACHMETSRGDKHSRAGCRVHGICNRRNCNCHSPRETTRGASSGSASQWEESRALFCPAPKWFACVLQEALRSISRFTFTIGLSARPS